MRWTRINSNGCKMYGGQPDYLEALLKDLARYPLNRTFERVFIQDIGNGVKRFQGNFLTVARVFDVSSNDPDVVQRLMDSILANRAMPAFKSQPSAMKQIRAIRKWLNSR